MGVAYRLVRPQLTLDDILRIKSSNTLRLTTSPFGLTPEEYARNPPVYISTAVSWKGRPENMPPAVRTGLNAAIAISKRAAGVRGTTLWNGRLYPAKCIAQKRLAGKMPA